MTRARLVSRTLAFAFILAAALASSSCNSSGVGVGMDYPARWGAGATGGPPIFVGGPGL
jgi:hypothetical protein